MIDFKSIAEELDALQPTKARVIANLVHEHFERIKAAHGRGATVSAITAVISPANMKITFAEFRRAVNNEARVRGEEDLISKRAKVENEK